MAIALAVSVHVRALGAIYFLVSGEGNFGTTIRRLAPRHYGCRVARTTALSEQIDLSNPATFSQRETNLMNDTDNGMISTKLSKAHGMEKMRVPTHNFERLSPFLRHISITLFDTILHSGPCSTALGGLSGLGIPTFRSVLFCTLAFMFCFLFFYICIIILGGWGAWDWKRYLVFEGLSLKARLWGSHFFLLSLISFVIVGIFSLCWPV
ncbi:hypothetical protein BJ878DRAFT_235171 [Calycina marina]|uniref:Uncharacterized protein n=1 Tax=Calycina marina TaxID=1763456 RepID=A0A9P7YWH9_9HELO|nr:hypothetical protein BJ878DRAFT_235171 [Calycina marina]